MLIQTGSRTRHAEASGFRPLAREVFGNLGLGFEVEPIQAQLQTVALGACRLSSIVASAHSVSGGRGARRSDDPDAIKLILQVDGSSRLRQNDVTTDIEPGSWAIYDPTRPYFLDNLTPVRQLILQMPRHSFPTPILDCVSRSLGVDNAERGLHKVMLAAVLSALEHAEALDEAGQVCLGETLLGLARALVTRMDMTAKQGSAQSLCILRLRVKAYIEAHLSRSDLDITELARKMGCSRRYLFRAFEQDGTTPSEFLWSLRLDKAHEKLVAPAFRNSSISEIAFSCGFSSSAHFSRAFRKRFEVTPSALRNAV